MSTAVAVQDKKDFIRWFLKTKKLKRRECVWILNYLLSHELLLESVVFTDEAHYCQRAMIMTSTGDDSVPFRFYKGDLMSADAEKAFHDLRLNPYETMHIEVKYPNKGNCPEYALVVERNEHLPESTENKQDRKEAEAFLSLVQMNGVTSMLMDKIDRALDAGDKEAFMELTGQLQ